MTPLPGRGLYRAFAVGDYVKLGFDDGERWMVVTRVSRDGHRARALTDRSLQVDFHNGHAIAVRSADQPPGSTLGDQLLAWFGAHP